MSTYLQYFFTYQDDLPDDVGFNLYGPEYFIWMTVIVAATILYALYYKKQTAKRQHTLDLILGCFICFWLIYRTLILLIIGHMSVGELPLHLCSMSGVLCLLHAIRKYDWLSQSLYTICLPGCCFGLLFCNWTMYPAIHFITIEGFSFHGAILVYLVSQLCTRQIVPSFGRLWKVIVFLFVVVTPVYFFDKAFDTNYMFVNWPSPGSPLEWLASFMGNPGYLIGYAVLILITMLLMDLGYALTAGRKR